MSYTIKVLENNTVEIFTEGQAAPIIRQPNWPNGTEWASADESRSWAEMYVESIEDENAPYSPFEPGGERLPKPTAEEIAAFRSEQEALRNSVAPE
jgi:hypothetical protein